MNAMNILEPWSTAAINLPDHADNLVHTDEGAIAAGFERALVAGTTVYAYMTHPIVAGWGVDWVANGGGELRLRKPVFDNDDVDCTLAPTRPNSQAGDGSRSASTSEDSTANVSTADDRVTVTAEVAGDPRATLEVWREVEAPPTRDGKRLRDVTVVLDQSHLDYGLRAGDDLSVYGEHRIAHPVTWANLANTVFKDELVTGPWVHVRSKIYHEGLATIGATVRAESWVIDRFDSRAGERALVDIRIYADDMPVVTIEHEAIIVLA